ncbi:pur operon repressor [Anaerovorax odorimutans]|uniref:Pur operon repressor n=1 Tax=Anaerovorax odorimutans TaxID=109327 RepID=A0ABT1RPE0_9FIRM|nr:pur operon repressor [Anaerovorax odorimutans]MCQ4637060.1 pur operon repressor [Anaerovorax odorimutans]
MKRSQRVGAFMEIISNSPNKIFALNYFCDLFGAAKSSISEDIAAAREIAAFTGLGMVETIPGASGGVRYVPFISKEKGLQFQDKLCRMLREESRVLGGGFLYTSDIMFDPVIVKEMAQIFARKFRQCGADYIVTIETKGIPLALKTAEFLNLPSVVVRREAKISEGATMSINYLSGSSERMQKMSISKRAALSGSRALIIDDFMRGGGSVKGISDILSEFDTQVVGIGVAIANIAPEKKKIADYIPLVYLGNVDEESRTVEVFPNSQIF